MLVSAIALAATCPIIKVNPPAVAPPVGSYSHAAIVPPGSRMLYLAGQIGNRPDGSLGATIEEQAVQALENVRLILASQGAGPEHVVKLMFYASARPTRPGLIGAKRAEMFKGVAPPPSTWIFVTQMIRPEYLIEVEAIAAIPPGPC